MAQENVTDSMIKIPFQNFSDEVRDEDDTEFRDRVVEIVITLMGLSVVINIGLAVLNWILKNELARMRNAQTANGNPSDIPMVDLSLYKDPESPPPSQPSQDIPLLQAARNTPPPPAPIHARASGTPTAERRGPQHSGAGTLQERSLPPSATELSASMASGAHDGIEGEAARGASNSVLLDQDIQDFVKKRLSRYGPHRAHPAYKATREPRVNYSEARKWRTQATLNAVNTARHAGVAGTPARSSDTNPCTRTGDSEAVVVLSQDIQNYVREQLSLLETLLACEGSRSPQVCQSRAPRWSIRAAANTPSSAGVSLPAVHGYQMASACTGELLGYQTMQVLPQKES